MAGAEVLMQHVALDNITKSFAHTRAVNQISITFRAGEIHALVGENGAGKSTLMHVLSGLYRPDTGTIFIDHQRHCFSSPRAALAAGIAMVHQHFMLVPSLTVAENIYLALPHKPSVFVRRHLLSQRIRQLAEHYHIALDSPDEVVSNLSIGARQRVEILKALASESRCLILDEPTAVLTPAEVDNLFLTLRSLRQEGYIIIFITHKIPEV
ncbi:MAG: ATP-binding cassette domain-containing protein, partial [Anaerolineales bacterium]|nr:ATP-binding cassette domain-containing protein [Anaerolineales bacterium]MDW8447943.1 ATP-binding cassette domain-containing protein [Anaerolineales bacterium]